MILESVNALRWCPRIGRHSEHRNRQKMQLETWVQPGRGEFVIAATKSAAEEYCTYYDHLHPHFKIENGFLSVQPDDWSMQNMMLIFRRDFTEVIEIGTSLQVGHRPHIWPGPGTFHSKAHVHCIVQRISNPDHDGLRFLRALKNVSGYREEFLTLVDLLDQIAQRLPPQQEEEDDHSDESEEDAQMLNHQLHVVPVPPQRIQMPPPPPALPQMQVNHHQPRAAPAPPQVLVNNHLSIAPVPQQMPPPPPPQVQVSNHQPRAAPAPQKMIPPPPEVHAALVPQQMPPPQVQVGNQPRAALVTRVQQIPRCQVPLNHHLGDAPVLQQMPPPPQMQGNHQPRAAPAPPQMQGNHQPRASLTPQKVIPPPQVKGLHAASEPQQMPVQVHATPMPQMQGNHQPCAALAPQKSIPPPEVKELHAASEPQQMPVQVHATLMPQARRGDCGD